MSRSYSIDISLYVWNICLMCRLSVSRSSRAFWRVLNEMMIKHVATRSRFLNWPKLTRLCAHDHHHRKPSCKTMQFGTRRMNFATTDNDRPLVPITASFSFWRKMWCGFLCFSCSRCPSVVCLDEQQASKELFSSLHPHYSCFLTKYSKPIESNKYFYQ